jgi:hypothetical protein
MFKLKLFITSFILIFTLNSTFSQDASGIEKLLRNSTPEERELTLYVAAKEYCEDIAEAYVKNYSPNLGSDLKLKLFSQTSQKLMNDQNEFGYRFVYWWGNGSYELYGRLFVNQYTGKTRFEEESVSDNILAVRKNANSITVSAQNIKDALDITIKLVELFKALKK